MRRNNNEQIQITEPEIQKLQGRKSNRSLLQLYFTLFFYADRKQGGVCEKIL